MPLIELHFPVLGSSLPVDHGYALYSALSRFLPAIHNAGSRVFLAPIGGRYAGNGTLHLEFGRSCLRVRLPTEDIPSILPLAGKSLALDGHRIRFGVPQVRSLVPAVSLGARMVTMKRSDRHDANGTKAYMEPASFLEAVQRELGRRGVRAAPGIPLVREGPRVGQPVRRVLRIKNKRVVGFPLQITGLTADVSIELQENGLGGRRKMGCGFFVAIRESQS
jgi:CRISPR-associated protein Cas6